MGLLRRVSGYHDNPERRKKWGAESKNLPLVAYYRVVVETEDKSVPLLRIGREWLVRDAL